MTFPIDYTTPKKVLAQGIELELTVFAMTASGNDCHTIAETRDDIAFYDVILHNSDYQSFLWEFENLSDENSAAISMHIEQALGVTSDYVGP